MRMVMVVINNKNWNQQEKNLITSITENIFIC